MDSVGVMDCFTLSQFILGLKFNTGHLATSPSALYSSEYVELVFSK